MGRSLQAGTLLLVFTGLILLLGRGQAAARSAQHPIIDKWQFEQIPWPVDLAREVASGDAAGALAIDSEARVHLVLGYPLLMYALRDEGGWRFQPIASGTNPSLALDSLDRPHLTYSHDGAIHYAVLDDGSWEVKHVIDDAGSPNGLALDVDDRPHIAYIRLGSEYGSPAHATWDGVEWHETVVAPDRVTSNVGIGLTGQGAPIVVYERTDDREYQIVAATRTAGGAWDESIIERFEDFVTNIYDWRPNTMQVSSDAQGRLLVSLAYGAKFIIKPPYIMYHYADLIVRNADGTGGGAFASLYELGYDTAAPTSVTHGAGMADDAFLALTVGDDLWFLDAAADSTGWQQIANSRGISGVAVGPDGQPRIVFGNSEGLWYGQRVEVELQNQAFLPVAGYRWVGDWIATDALGVTSAVWVDAQGHPMGGDASRPSISADSRYVAFESTLDYWGTHPLPAVFLGDRATGTARCISVDQTGVCRYSAWSSYPIISADGRYVVFETSNALLPADVDGPGDYDVYLYDRETDTLSLVSGSTDFAPVSASADFPFISADGRTIAYSQDDGAYGILLYDRETGITTRLDDDPSLGEFASLGWFPVLSNDGRHVAFQYYGDLPATGDHNGRSDVFVYDRQTGELELVSKRSDGTQAESESGDAQISADGRYVAFVTEGSLVPQDTNDAADVYRHDRQTGETVWVSRNVSRTGAASFAPAMSADGRLIAFESYANFGVVADANSLNDVYLVEVGQTPELLSATPGGLAGNIGSATPAMTPDGRFIVFKSEASNLIPGDTNDRADIFIRRVR